MQNIGLHVGTASMFSSSNDKSKINPLRILVISSSPFARAGLASMIDQQPPLSVVGQISSDEELPDALDLYRPDVLVWEMGWEPLQHLEKLNDTRSARIPTLALIAEDPNAKHAAAVLINAGVSGVLLHDTQPERLTAALVALGQGLTVMTPALVIALAEASFAPALPGVTPVHPLHVESLTGREAEVLNLIAEGLPNKIIATKLSISEHTVKFHVNAILTKLGAQSRTEAVVRATRAGLIAL